MNCRSAVSGFLFLFLTFAAKAAPVVIDFESFNDSDLLTNQLSGLIISNTIVLTSGISLNGFEFPPNSGLNVASDNGGFISIFFAAPVASVAGFFTYAEPLTIQAFGVSNNLLATSVSAFSNNLALSGDAGSTPNEFLSLTSVSGIFSVTFGADPNGGSFTLDDLTYEAAIVTSDAPEPGAFLLSLLGGATIAAVYCLRRRRALFMGSGSGSER